MKRRSLGGAAFAPQRVSVCQSVTNPPRRVVYLVSPNADRALWAGTERH